MTATASRPGLDGYSAAERRRTQLIEVADRMTGIARDLSLDALADGVERTADRVRSDAFVVTVLGDFNTGKSTLINALLGADTLPRLPIECTALLTEVRWGDEPAALLYPRTADGGVAEDPEPADINRLSELIVVDVDEPEAQSPYARAEVRWPLELCRNNVVLVDSPGLNADPLREELTMEYLTRTDAVVFVLDARANMKRNEVDFMTSQLDSHDPFFILNFINQIQPEEQELVRRSAFVRLQKARPDHPADERRIYWVDALAGIRARKDENVAAWDASGVAKLQRDLELFLTTERHKIKILLPARQLRVLRREVGQSIAKQQAMLTEDLQDLTRRYAEAQVPLQQLEQDAERISRDLANQLGDLEDEVARRIEGKLSQLTVSVPGFAVEAIPDQKLSLKPWKTAEQAEAVAGEIAEITARRVEAEFSEWVRAELQADLTKRMERMAESLNAQVAGFEQDLDALRLDMSGAASDVRSRASKDDETPLTRTLAAVGGGIIAGPAAGLAGARFGTREMAKALLPGLAIHLVWLFTPFGWGVLAAALVAQAIVGAPVMLKGAERRLKQTVGEEMANELRGRLHKDSREAAARLAKQLDEVRVAVFAGLDAQLATFRQEVETVLAAKRAGEAAASARGSQLTRLAQDLDDAMNQLDDIVDEIAAI
ncbi:dynamin family protein [Pseudonocardia sp. RS11V-5]|uniref:dynamin family protein n=1 Tax=Pseudonocardia terrae TaxID=2905831 RepID=UPI001E4EEDD9|nr:dynamin family protein [Pseudonocardia terrae]MCE3555582.1 dynamin family protein [Pseudonocardia terrae]